VGKLQRNNDDRVGGEMKVILDSLQESMRAVRNALAQPTGVSPETLKARLEEWRHSLSELSRDVAIERKDLLATLYEIGQTINSSLDLGETLDMVVDALILLTGAERGCLMLLDDDEELSIQLARNFGGAEELELSHSVIREVVEQKGPVLTTNAQHDPRFAAQESVIGYNLRSIACVPLQVRGEVTGALYLDNPIREAVFSEADLALLSAFANQAAVAIENARLYTMTDQALAARVEELTTMQEIDRQLNASLDFQHVLELTLSWAMRATESDVGAVGLIEEEGLRVAVRSEQDEQLCHMDEERLDLVKNSREPILVGNMVVLVPIRYEDQTVGVLDLRRNSGRVYDADELQFASRLADHAAMAIENARLYEQVQQANQAKTEFVSVVVHELRTPMTSIKGYADMMAKGMLGEMSEDQTEFLRTIVNNVQRMQILVSDLQDVSRIESGQLHMEMQTMAIEEAVNEGVNMLQRQIEEKDQTLSLEIPPDLPEVYGDPSRTTQVLINLLSNAYKYTPEGGDIRVELGREGGFVRCSVTDSGIGISPESQAKLFTKFYRTDNPDARDQPGTGLGLCIVKNIVELQGGEITVKSELDEGSTFSFTVPTAESVAVE
jgi:signal transduction histidine kinase